MTIFRASRHGTLLLLLVAAALAMRALLPGGTMVAADGRGDLVVTLCNSDAMMTIPMKEKAPLPGDEGGEKTCAFVHLADNSVPPDPLARPALPQVAEAVWNATRERALSPVSAHDLPPATGPPAKI
ncbi:hypothetical protein [Alteraurantiacibacter palmitatis]|uniref:DUF2946 domain-containing protein n=1 Tax=Alteraurantiacibacter palmitatis TaxID=2054628 RepID=A0ABV7E754_9SPHN